MKKLEKRYEKEGTLGNSNVKLGIQVGEETKEVKEGDIVLSQKKTYRTM